MGLLDISTNEKILILGSIASGKTTLARRLSNRHAIEVIHVDQIEFNSDLSKKNSQDVRQKIKNAVAGERWILDGYGPLDLLPQHLKNADRIIYLDFPLYLNLYWLLKRQMQIRKTPRMEMPEGADEWNWAHFKKIVETLIKQHRLMNRELLRILQKPENIEKLIHVKNRRMLDNLA